MRMHALRLALLLITLAAHPVPAARPAEAPRAGLDAYAGTGAWIDRYDYPTLGDPEVAAGEMAIHGVRTLYMETASWKVGRSVDVVDPVEIAGLIDAAHANGMRVVAWYLPGLVDRALDMRRIRAALGFTTPDGQRFDSFALDIEATLVRSIRRRNLSLLRLSRELRRTAGEDYALGAIVPDRQSTSYGNVLWPGFPYAALAATYDVFLPMAYSSVGRAASASGVYDYTAQNIAYVQDVTHRPVHVIGGIADDMTADAEQAVVRAASDVGAYGVSLYKYTRYGPGSWTALATFAP
jgi:hypothetical protein